MFCRSFQFCKGHVRGSRSAPSIWIQILKRNQTAVSRQFSSLVQPQPINYLHVQPSYMHVLGARPLVHETIGHALERAANTWPDRPWLVSCQEEESMTFSQVLQEADRLAAGLLQLGLQPGDRLGVCAPNVLRWKLLMMAAARCGVITVCMNPAYQPQELSACLEKVGVKALAISSQYRGRDNLLMTESIRRGGNLAELKVVIDMDDTSSQGAYNYCDILGMANPQAVHSVAANQHLMDPDKPFVILFTSGTTGTPKAATLSHFSYVNNSWEVGVRNEMDVRDQKVCLQIPLFHAFGLLMSLSSLQHGSPLVFPAPAYSVDLIMKAVIKESCTVLTGTPTMYVDLVTARRKSGARLISPQIAVTGGAICSQHLQQQIQTWLGVSSVKSLYGMTEACSIFQSVPGDDVIKSAKTVGRLFGHLEAKVVDSDGKTVPEGCPGELYIRSYAAMMQYWGEPDKTNDVITDNGWLRTGDQFVLEDGAYGRISGRLKDLIIRGGENIFPKEIEDFLNTHPDVIETQVFGVKDDRLGEEICASVRLREGAMFGYPQMKAFCSGALAHFKIPRLLKIVDKFPVTASGKIQKYKLREMVESGQI